MADYMSDMGLGEEEVKIEAGKRRRGEEEEGRKGGGHLLGTSSCFSTSVSRLKIPHCRQ